MTGSIVSKNGRASGSRRSSTPSSGGPARSWNLWTGLASLDAIPASTNVYIATGDSGHGMTHGTIAGMLICDLINGSDNPWRKLYDPSRKTLKAAGEFARFNLHVAKQYVGIVTAGSSRSPESIPHGTGAVIRRGVEKIAVYCDENGTTARVLRRMPSSRLHRGLERHGENVGLSLSRVALQSRW